VAASAKRNAKIEITAENRTGPGLNSARRDLNMMRREQANANRAASREAKEQRRAIAEGASRVNRGVGSLATSAVGFGMGALKAAGMPGLDEMIADVFDASRELTRFQIDAQLSRSQVAAFNDELLRVSNATGVSRHALIEAAHAYQILTGDAAGAVASSQLFAEVANASGSNMQDIAAAAASMRKNLNIDPSDFRAGFDILLNMGHKASVELRDFAGEMADLNPMFKDFGGKSSTEKLAEMAAVLEVTKYNFGNASEAANGFKQAMTQISKSKVSEKFAAHGVKIWDFDPKTKTHVKRDYFDVIKDIHDKIKDRKVLSDILGGRQEAYRAFTAQLDHYEEMLALQKESQNSNQVAKDNQTWMESSSGRLAKLWEQIKNSVAEAFSPDRIEAFVSILEKAGQAYNAIFQFGRKVRGVFSGNAAATYSEEDLAMFSGSGVAQLLARGATPEEIEHRKAAAERNMANTRAFNAAAENIMGGEVNEASTPESIRRALEAKYSSGFKYSGASDAGATYLKNAGYNDPIDVARKSLEAINTAAAQQQLARTIAEAIKTGLAGANISVTADGSKIAGVTKNALVNVQRRGRH
jgi:hypothetical protein